MTNNWSSWLEEVGYPYNGVGDLQDLKFSLGVGDGGRWIGFINSGWFYHNEYEQYKYALRGLTTVSASGGVNLAQHNVSFRPAWGPILVTDSASGQYTPHHNVFSPANTASWTSSGLYYYTTVASSDIVVSVLDLTILPLGRVEHLGNVVSDKQYYYDQTNSRVWIRPKQSGTINVFLNLIKAQPVLKFREIVANEDGGVVNPSYLNIESTSVIKGYQTQSITGTVTSSITHSLTGLNVGDWVVLEYYIRQSYIVPQHNQLLVYTTSGASATLYIFYETSIPDVQPNIRLTHPLVQDLNFNTLFSDAYRVGYLFHRQLGTVSASSLWDIDNIQLELDKPSVCAQWNEPFKLSLMLVNKNGLPVPHYPFSLTLTSGASSLSGSVTGLTTDGRGEYNTLITCSSAMTVLTIVASALNVSATVSGAILNQLTMISSSLYQNGFTETLVSNQLTPRRYKRLYAKHMTLDGIPKPNTQIKILTDKSSVLEYKNTLYTKLLDIQGTITAKNVDCILGYPDANYIGYLPQGEDKITSGKANVQGTIVNVELD